MGEYADMENSAGFEDYISEFDRRKSNVCELEDIETQTVAASNESSETSEQINILESEAETTELIIIKQLPEFEQSFIRANAEIQKRLAFLKDFDISEESKNQAKKIKAELNKEFMAFEERRKFVKTEINKPYTELEELYKGHISKPYTDAIRELTQKIGDIERKQTEQKYDEACTYFMEYRDSIGDDLAFLHFERLSVTVNLSVTLSKLKDEIRKKCDKIKADIDSLRTMGELADRYIVCYRNLLDISKAIAAVNEAAEEERRLKAEKEQNAENEAAKKRVEAKVETVIAKTAQPEVTAAVEIVEDEPRNETKKDLSFTARQITKMQFEKMMRLLYPIIQFMESEGIKYEWNK